VAVGPARPDPKARRVTAEMCRAILERPNLTDEEAEGLLDHLYLVANVAVDAFIEQRGRTEKIISATLWRNSVTSRSHPSFMLFE
jgi:hypothetical protein